jgi:glyoxylase-like metal-dependent hydrolase (beta-lactamase superfamily II)
MVEDPQALFALRYNHLEREHSVSIAREFLPFAGQRRRVDLTFTGGETIRLSDGWSLEVLHVPGHSHGHLALYDRTRRAAFVGDAIHGRGCPSARGELAIPVTYYYVDIYLSTLRYFETLAIDVLYSGHWPEMQGEEIRDFIALSRQTVETIDRAILRALDKQAGGLTLERLIDVAADAIGDWPPESLVLAMWPVYGHMERLVGRGRVRVLEGARPVKWQKV